ncbi:FAD-dependent oxidoreductase [Nocardioides alcanivorans]|uniref:FAD-dependent oxidoreductase n=1 Tax=Nocardioides alcanivorans TaxID=2897352 RepID=UPI001F27C340|nr:FAD-dependent oxidoreductase [Nocardioides alcanivorans]
MTRSRMVVVGGDAAGMSAAHQALRSAQQHGRELEVTVLEATEDTSYSACGIPYWISGEVDSRRSLIARTPEVHRQLGVDLRTGARATHVDHDAGEVHWVGPDGEQRLGYDDLVIATGAPSIVPDWARDASGAPGRGVQVVKTLDDGAWWIRALAGAPKHVVVAGGSYIGLEMAEAMLAHGHRVTLMTRSRVMSNLDEPMSDRVATALDVGGVTVHTGAAASGVERAADGSLAAVLAGDLRVEADLLVLAIGVTPATEIVQHLDLPRSRRGALRPDPHGRLADGLWAAGDCCDVRHRITGDWAYLPLGTHANKMGRATGDTIGGGDLTFPGALGTAITRFAAGAAYAEIARTGLGLVEAQEAGFKAVEVTTDGTTASGYHPDAQPIALSVVGEQGTGRLLGAQLVGGRGSAKRIDTVAMALWSGSSVADLAWADLAYAPPFATAWEFVSLAARRLAERL